MTLAETLLPKLSDWRPAGAGRHTWAESLADTGWTVHLAADKADSLSCLVWELTLTRADSPTGRTLKTWADSVVCRASGLIEELKVYEIDPTRDEAILRSDSPTARGEKLAYYEIRLNGLTRATVRRFSAARATPGRDQIAFALTHEVLAKLAEDIGA